MESALIISVCTLIFVEFGILDMASLKRTVQRLEEEREKDKKVEQDRH